MKLTFIGTGSSFTVGDSNYQSNILIESNTSRNLLIGCGSDARIALHEMNLSYRNIQDVYVCNLHTDNVGGLEWLAFSSYFDSSCNKPGLFGNVNVLERLWDKVLRGGLSSLKNIKASLDTYFDVHPVTQGKSFDWEGTSFELVQTLYANSGKITMNSYGLFFSFNGTTIFIAANTQTINPKISVYFEKADVIFQDCETSENETGIRVRYEELNTLPTSIKQKMWLYYSNPGELPDAPKDGFQGFLEKGQTFTY